MTIELKLRQQSGNSVVAEFPEEALKLLNAQDGDSLYLTQTPDGIRISAKDPHYEEAMAAAEEGMRKYREALRELAK